MSTLVADLRYGVRMLWSSPRVTLVALLSLALGIGANTAIFTVINGLILRPLPYAEPDRLVMVYETSPDNDRRWVAPANFLDWRRDTTSFEQLAAYDTYNVNLTGRDRPFDSAAGTGRLAQDRPERLRAASVSGNFFQTLGVQAVTGRTFVPADDRPGATRTAVLTHGGWQRVFGGLSVVGATLTIDDTPHEVIGVLPQAFQFLPDVEIYTSSEQGVPRTFPFPTDVTSVRDSHIIFVLGRLKPQASIEQAHAEIGTIMKRLEAAHPDTNTGLSGRVLSLHDDLVAGARSALWLLLGAVAFLLLIACVNVANLLLARAVARQREMGIRVALGASRGRLVRQLLTETALLAIAGGALALLIARWGVTALLAIAPTGLPRATEIHVDATTFAFTMLASLVTAALFGLVPAWQASLPAKAGSHTRSAAEGLRATEGRSHRRLHHALVVSELALAQVLLAGAGLLIASFVNLQQVNLGFAPDRLLAVELSTPPGRYPTPERKLAFNQAILERMRAIPGVSAAAATLTVPLRGAINRGVRFLDRPEPPAGQQPNVDFMIVSPDYFATLGIPVVAGRPFTDHDSLSTPRVVLVSQAMANRYWPGANPIGKRVGFGRSNSAEVIGIVGDVRQRDPARAPEPLLYSSFLQDNEPWNFIAFALRTSGDPASLASAARDAVLAVDPQQPVARIRTMDEIAGSLVADRRFNTVLLAVFSGLALLLAAIGTYGVMAYSVTRRTREIGVRMALGARPRDVLGMVLGQGAVLVGLAIAIGVAGAVATNRLLAQQLFEVTATDPATLAAGAATLCAFALVACYLPARRAMRVEPLVALRDE